jgi:arylsulfatase A-like enzyme
LSTALPNLLLLTIDAWRADFVDSYDGVPLTPTLHAELDRAVRFDNAYASGPWTSPALVSIFSGEDPAGHDVHYEWSTPRPGGPGLVSLLKAAGYAAPNLCYLNRVGNYQNLGYAAADAPGYPQGQDDDLLPRTLRALRKGEGGSAKEPWFLWYHYKYVHLPYWPAAAYRRMFGVDDDALPARLRESVCSRFVVPRHEFPQSPDDREAVRRLYAGGVRQMDDFLARVWSELLHGRQGERLIDRTAVVLTADHGDELLEHGHVGHASTAHHATLHEEVLRVPLFLFHPRLCAARRVSERVQGPDLFPTILSLCGVRAPAVSGRGPCGGAVDLSPLVFSGEMPAGLLGRREFLFQSSRMGYQTPRSRDGQMVTGISDGVRKYVYEAFDAPRRLLYDLCRDPLELHPQTDGDAVAAAHAELCAALGQKPGTPAAEGAA